VEPEIINPLDEPRLRLEKQFFISDHFHLTRQEATDLYNYFMKVGYISYETDMPIHDLFKKLRSFVVK
jgi:hypothetical protein